MFFNLLHLGNGVQALNYFALCFFAILGTLQLVAAKYQRRDLMWANGTMGALLIVASFAWFFVTDQEIFIPGLAGGELFTIFIVAFILAVPVTRALADVSLRVPTLAPHCVRCSAGEGRSNPQVAWRLPRLARDDKSSREKEPMP